VTVDPVASLRIWVVDLTLADQVFEVPGLPAADWFPILVTGDLLAVLDLIDQADRVDDLLVAGEVTAEELSAGIQAVIEQVCGRPFHAALLLATLASELWQIIGGELALAGFQWDRQPIAAALDAIYRTAMRVLKKEYWDKIQAMVDSDVSTTSIGGTGRRRRLDRRQAMADFQEMAGPPPSGPAIAAPSAGALPRSPRPPRQPRQDGPSGEPTPPPGLHAGSGPPASHVGPWAASAPTSGSGSPPPQQARSRLRGRSAGSGSGRAPLP
jgi:hypothetical protein